jgi:hypothetical protein
MDRAGQRTVFVELDPFGERHGSWQRTIHAFTDGLDRYVLVALTGLDDHDEVSVTAGAEQRLLPESGASRPFRRFDVGTIRLESSDVDRWPKADLATLLEQAIRMALDIEVVQLQERQLLAS